MRWGGWHNLEGRRVVVLCCVVLSRVVQPSPEGLLSLYRDRHGTKLANATGGRYVAKMPEGTHDG